MSDSNNLPQAISHKKLSFLLLNALKDKSITSVESEKNNEEHEELLAELNNWENLTKKLLNKISITNESVLEEKSSESIMALGAMEVHLNMALQALKVFKKNK